MARNWLHRRTAITVGLVVILLIAVAWLLPGFIKGYQEGYQEGLLTGIHDSCVSSATETARARRLDVTTPEIERKIESSCSCVVGSVESGKVTTAEMRAFSADPQAADPAVAKVRQLVATCLR